MRWLFLLLLCGVCFAADTEWVNTSILAILASVSLLGLLYMAGMGFGINELKILAHEEFYQAMVTLVLIVVLLASDTAMADLANALGFGGKSIQDNALDSLDNLTSRHKTMYDNMQTFAIQLGRESSESKFCSLEGLGFSISPCGAFSGLTPIVSLSMQAIGASVTELSSMRVLVAFGKTYAFTLLLPIGIFFRTLKFSRGAGAMFIALAVALYLFLPISVVFITDLTSETAPELIDLPEPKCDVSAFAETSSAGFALNVAALEDTYGDGFADGFIDQYNLGTGFNYKNTMAAMGVLKEMNSNALPAYIHAFLIEGTLTTIVGLLALVSSLRFVSKLAGSDVDVSGLMRIA